VIPVMKKTLTTLVALSVLNPSIAAVAAMPDVETYNTVRKKYTLFIRETRDSCVFYTDPKFVTANPKQRDIRQLIVLQTQSDRGGTACEGMFQFQYADVNCKTNQLSFTHAIGSPATWKYERYTDAETTKKICALPIVEFGIPSSPPAK
jgi:hypothetical protein